MSDNNLYPPASWFHPCFSAFQTFSEHLPKAGPGNALGISGELTMAPAPKKSAF